MRLRFNCDLGNLPQFFTFLFCWRNSQNFFRYLSRLLLLFLAAFEQLNCPLVVVVTLPLVHCLLHVDLLCIHWGLFAFAYICKQLNVQFALHSFACFSWFCSTFAGQDANLFPRRRFLWISASTRWTCCR